MIRRSRASIGAASLLTRTLLLALTLLPGPEPALAHETLPGVLELRERAGASYVLIWRAPVGSDGPVPAHPVFPQDCRFEGSGGSMPLTGTAAARGILRCGAILRGREISIGGWRGGSPAVLVRVRDAGGREEDHLLRPAQPAVVLQRAGDPGGLLSSYFALGVTHILQGVDHLLFVAGLMLLTTSRARLVATITAFTVAHSITIAAATLGWMNPRAPPVEVAIALSVVFVALEAARAQRGSAGFTLRHPWVAAFAFGLLHGFGFAGALSMTGVAVADVPLALLAFNLGVEAGQLAFMLAVAAIVVATRPLLRSQGRWLRQSATLGIGGFGAWWTMDRIAALLAGGA